MDFFINHNSRVESYFIAWEKYDINLLKRIFSPNAHYVIKDKCTYYGIDEIVAYWLRNKNRQENLQLKWNVLKSEKLRDIVSFNAIFWDLEENMHNKVNGEITFEYTDENSIILLSEFYNKEQFL